MFVYCSYPPQRYIIMGISCTAAFCAIFFYKIKQFKNEMSSSFLMVFCLQCVTAQTSRLRWFQKLNNQRTYQLLYLMLSAAMGVTLYHMTKNQQTSRMQNDYYVSSAVLVANYLLSFVELCFCIVSLVRSFFFLEGNGISTNTSVHCYGFINSTFTSIDL